MSANAIPLLAALTRLWNEAEEQVRHFPKRDTQLLGRTMLDDLDSSILHVLRALQDGTNRRRWLVEASAHYDRAKLKLRVAVKRELISERWYAAHLDTLAEVGRMIGGWQRAAPPPTLLNAHRTRTGCGAFIARASRAPRRRPSEFAFRGSSRYRFNSSAFQFTFTAGLSGNRIPRPHPNGRQYTHAPHPASSAIRGQRVGACPRDVERPSWMNHNARTTPQYDVMLNGAARVA